MLTTAQRAFSRGGAAKEKYWERWRGGKRREERQTKVRKTFVFSRFPLVWRNSPTARGVAFSEPPSRTSKQNLISKTTVHNSRNIWSPTQQKKSCQRVHIWARRRTGLIPKMQCLSVLVFTCVLHPELLLRLLGKAIRGKGFFSPSNLASNLSLQPTRFWLSGADLRLSTTFTGPPISSLSPVFFSPRRTPGKTELLHLRRCMSCFLILLSIFFIYFSVFIFSPT